MRNFDLMAPVRLSLALAAVTLIAACSNGDGDDAIPAGPPVTGQLEVIHASEDAPNVDVLIDGNFGAGNLAFKNAAFISAFVGERQISVEGILPGGNVEVIPAATITVSESDRVTVIAAGDVASIAPIVLADTPPTIDAADVRVRVLHAASTAPQVEVYITAPGTDLTTVAATGIFSFGELLTPDALVVPAGTYQIQVTLPGDPTAVVYDSGSVDLPSGADLIVAAVTNTGTGVSPISLIASTGSAVLEFLDVDTPADVRVVHASPDAPAVDVVANDDFAAPAVVALAYPDFTGYLSLPAGPINAKVVPTGTMAPVVIDADLSLTPGLAYTVMAADLLANIQPLVLVDDNRRIATEAKVRIVHTSPSAGDVDIYVTEPGASIDAIDPAFADVAFLADTGYVSLAAGSYDVTVTPAGSKTAAIGPATIAVDAGGIYTAAARDEVGSGTPLGLILFDDF